MTVRSEYNVADLRKQIGAKRDSRIAKAEETFARDSDYTARHAEWRTEAEASIRALHRRLKTVTDAELAGFRVKAAPSVREWRTPEEERDRQISDANETHDRAMRRLDAMRSDKGVLSLTPSMLREIFGL